MVLNVFIWNMYIGFNLYTYSICESNISGTQMTPQLWNQPLVDGPVCVFDHFQIMIQSKSCWVLRGALVAFGVLNDGLTPKEWDKDW